MEIENSVDDLTDFIAKVQELKAFDRIKFAIKIA